MPAVAGTVSVPESVAPPGFAPNAMVTGVVAVVTGFPNVSRTATCTAGAIAAPTTTGLG